MPLLLLLCLILACLPIEWPAPPYGLGPAGSAALTGSVVIVLLLVAKLFTIVTETRLARDPRDREVVARAHNLRRLVFFFLNLAGFGLVLACCGWGYTATSLLTVDELVLPGAEIFVLAPFLISLIGSWAIFYDAENALHRSIPGVGGPFWSRLGYVFFLFRYNLLLVFIPVGFTIAQFGTLRVAPGLFGSPWAKLGALAGLCAFIVLLPSLIPLILALKPMPACKLRDRLEAAARRLRVRYHELYVWDTRGNLATAMVSGLVPRLRQVVFTDLLLATMTEDEVEGVFGHEVGHVRHGHLLYYAAFLLLSSLTLLGVYQLLEHADGLAPLPKNTALVLSTVGIGAYLFLAFGFISRRCERQADVFGCKAVSCATPGCLVHGPDTVLAAGGKTICRTGVGTFVRALERVEEINGMTRGPLTVAPRGLLGRSAGLLRFVGVWLSTWQHSTISNRVTFLRTLAEDPARERRFQRRVTALRWSLLGLLTIGVIVIIVSSGWRSLLEAV